MIITTSESIEKAVKSKNLTLIDDINRVNKDEIFKVINGCDLFITSKFKMPPSNTEAKCNTDGVTQRIMAKLNKIEADVKNNNSSMFMNESQFNNFKIKVMYWCSTIFKEVITKLNNDTDTVTIVVKYTPSKHEWEMIKILSSIGFHFLIISDSAAKLAEGVETAKLLLYNTHENIEYTENSDVATNENVDGAQTKKYDSLEELEDALYNNSLPVKANVIGISNYTDTCNFYAKLNKTCNSNESWLMINNGFRKPSYEKTAQIPRFANTNKDYIVHTLCTFIHIHGEDRDAISEIIKNEVASGKYSDVSPQILYNKLVYLICVLNSTWVDHLKCIVFYGKANKNDEFILDIISQIKYISLIVACSDKEKAISIKGVPVLELSSTLEVFDIPLIDKRDDASTMAALAQRRVDDTLYSGDTLGMYKTGQFRTCQTLNFNTTYDELKLWWNKELYIRPGFEAKGDIAVLPTIFRVVKGCYDNSNEYIKDIQKFCCGKTILCKNVEELSSLVDNTNGSKILHLTDTNNTLFKDQKPFFEHNKLVRTRIKQGVNYRYKLLYDNKQDLILDKIEDILVSDKLNKSDVLSSEGFIDRVLNIGLNLGKQIVQYIQWFEFYTYNPNLVLTITDESSLSRDNMILLVLLQNLGFDILIFVPTGYQTIEHLVGQQFVYDTNIIGEPNYTIDTSEIKVTDNIEIEEAQSNTNKKQGFFSRLFGK